MQTSAVSDEQNTLFRQLCIGAMHAFESATAVVSLLHVFNMRSKRQMIWIDATRVVTRVKYVRFIRYLSYKEFVDRPVSTLFAV